ncbi:hypothetical protein AB1E18_005274 [Capra hircus]
MCPLRLPQLLTRRTVTEDRKKVVLKRAGRRAELGKDKRPERREFPPLPGSRRHQGTSGSHWAEPRASTRSQSGARDGWRGSGDRGAGEPFSPAGRALQVEGGGQKRAKELSHPQRGEGARRSTKEGASDRRVTLRPRPRLPAVPRAGRRSQRGDSQRLRGALGPRDPPRARRQVPPATPGQPGWKPTPARAGSRDSGLRAPRASAQLPGPPPTPPPAPAPRAPVGGRGTHLRGGGRSPGRKRERRAEFVARLRLPGRGQAERAAAAGAAGAPGDSARRAHSAPGSGSRARPAPRPAARRGLRNAVPAGSRAASRGSPRGGLRPGGWHLLAARRRRPAGAPARGRERGQGRDRESPEARGAAGRGGRAGCPERGRGKCPTGSLRPARGWDDCSRERDKNPQNRPPPQTPAFLLPPRVRDSRQESARNRRTGATGWTLREKCSLLSRARAWPPRSHCPSPHPWP